VYVQTLGVYDVSGSAYTRQATSDFEVTQFFTDAKLPAPELPPRCSTSFQHWKDPPPSPPVECRATSSNFADSVVCEFLGQSKQSGGPEGADAATVEDDRPLFYAEHHRDATSTHGNIVPFPSSSRSADVWEMWRDGSTDHGNTDQCTETDATRLDALADSGRVGYTAQAYSNVAVPRSPADSSGLFQIGTDASAPRHSSTELGNRVNAVNGDGFSTSRYGLAAQEDVVGIHSEDTQNVGPWKRFDQNVWHVEQEKLKQISLDPPAVSDTVDDQLPDLSSSNRLSMTALRLYDSIYGGQSTTSAHHVAPVRSLSSAWMREQSQHAAHTPEQPSGSISVRKSERGPCPAIHRAVMAERHTKFNDAYSRNVCESEVGNSQFSSSSCLPQSHLSGAQQSLVRDDNLSYISKTSGGIAETFTHTDDISARLAADTSRQLALSERETYNTDSSSYVDNYPWQTTAHIPHSDVLQNDAVLARRPSIRELKSRFEGEASSDASVREASDLPASVSAAASRRQFESSLKVGRGNFHSRTGSEPGETSHQKLSFDERPTDVTASLSSGVDNISKNSAPKGRFVTRSSIAASAVVNLPILPNDADIDQAEHRQFERLVDRRKVFEAAADTQPVA